MSAPESAGSKPVRRFLIAQIICSLVIAGGASIPWGMQGFISVMLGGAIAMMNAVGTAFAWPRILQKKDVALALSIIVSKFALSIGVFYWLTLPSAVVWFGDQTIQLGSASGTLVGFVFGLASVVPAALVVATGDLRGSESAENNRKRDTET